MQHKFKVDDINAEVIYSKDERKLEDCIYEILKTKLFYFGDK